MANKYHKIIADQGATFVLDFTVKTDGTFWNLTTYSARMQVRTFASATDKLLDLTSGAGDIVLTAGGRVTVTVSAGRMANVVAGKHVYDLELVSAGNEVTRILQGQFIVDDEVTR
jgi:hypothetical protein